MLHPRRARSLIDPGFWRKAASVALALLIGLSAAWSAVAPAAAAGTAADTAVLAALKDSPGALADLKVRGQKKGGRLIVAQANDYVQFDPIHINDNPSLFELLNFYNPLLRTTSDGVGVEGGVADAWEAERGGRAWVFTIRQGIKFRDGSMVTGDDVKWSLDRTRGPDSEWASDYQQLDSIDVIDDRRVRVNLKTPWAPILSALAMFPSCITPKATFDVPNPDWDRTNGTGPFYLASWEKKAEVVLKANPNYWEPGKPYLDEIVVRIVPDDNSRVLQLQGGQVDVVLDLPLNQVPILSQQPNLVAKAYQQQAMIGIRLNNTKAPLDDVRVRQALNYATNKDALNRVVYFGLAEVQNSPIPKGTFWDKDLKPYPYDVAKAKELMAAAGQSAGFPAELQVRQGNAVHAQIAQVIKEQWREIGVDVTILPMESGLYRQRELRMEYYMSIAIWTNDMNDPTQVMHRVFDGRASSKAHLTGYNDDTVNRLMDEAEVEQDVNKRAEIYKEIQRRLQEGAHKVFLAYWPEAAANQKSVEGFLIDGLSYHRYQDVWLNR